MVHFVTLNRTASAELRAHLARRDMSIKDAAELIGVTQPWLARRLNGSTEIALDDLELICTKLEIPIQQVILPQEGSAA